MTRVRRGDEDGSVMLLVIGLTAILLGLVAVVVDVSAAALARRSVSSAADGAAVSAAQSADREAYLRGGPAGVLPLSEAQVQERVQAYADRAEDGQPGLRMTGRLDPGGTVVVTASRTVRLPFSGWVGIGEVTVTAQARARSPLS